MSNLPCVFCGKNLEQRIDKNGKPYFICDPCGLQMFIRRKQGIDNLRRLVRTLKNRDLPLREHAHILFQVRAILQELEGVERELGKLDSSTGLFSGASKEK